MKVDVDIGWVEDAMEYKERCGLAVSTLTTLHDELVDEKNEIDRYPLALALQRVIGILDGRK